VPEHALILRPTLIGGETAEGDYSSSAMAGWSVASGAPRTMLSSVSWKEWKPVNVGLCQNRSWCCLHTPANHCF